MQSEEISVSPYPNNSLKKLLNSHSSIYEALANPELELNSLSPRMSNHPQQIVNKERFPTPIDQLQSKNLDFSWQSINYTESLQNVKKINSAKDDHKTTSILSITSDEDDHLVKIPSARSKNYNSVMVFETDEEDDGFDDIAKFTTNESCVSYDEDEEVEDDEKTLNVNLNHTLQSFVMPKMSISDKCFQITILSSKDFIYHQETINLLEDMRNNWDFDSSYSIHVNHLSLDSGGKTDYNLIQNSNLIFIINDGSMVFTDLLTLNEDYPKVTVINMMTVNYFANLFDLINILKPYQVWKSSSLKQTKLINNMKNFIKNELSDDFICQDGGGGKYNLEYCKKLAHQHSKHSNSIYSNLVPNKKLNYKNIEKQFKSDLQYSSIYENIDPLKLSSNFYKIDILYAILGKLFHKLYSSPRQQALPPIPNDTPSSSLSNTKNIWLFCSFSLGIGLGISIASGAITVIGLYIYDQLYYTFNTSRESLASPSPFYDAPSETSLLNQFSESVLSSLPRIGELTNLVSNSLSDLSYSIINGIDYTLHGIDYTLKDFYNFNLDSLKVVSDSIIDHLEIVNSTLMDSVLGGVSRLTTTLFIGMGFY